MGSEQNRFLQLQQPRASRRETLGGCLGGLSCFRKQKGGKRIVPATRISEANPLSNQPNGPQLPNHPTGITLSLFAPPSSPASFLNSALASTVQSPISFSSANSPVGPSSTMFVTGPYAYETQLVSPPVFSTYTTEPSTAPFTPPPELAHLTTPSSPDVPYAHFLSSSSFPKKWDSSIPSHEPKYKKSNSGRFVGAARAGAETTRDCLSSSSSFNEREWDSSIPSHEPAGYKKPDSGRLLGAAGAGAGTARDCLSSSSSSFNEREFPEKWDSSIPSQKPARYKKPDSGKLLGAAGSRQDSNFFCPETFAQFYLDQSAFSNGRLSISKESDAYSNGGNGYQNRQNKTSKGDSDEVEAYRASFGFSADEIITTTHYVEISDVYDDSFSMSPFTSNNPIGEETEKSREEFSNLKFDKSGLNHGVGIHSVLTGRSLESNHFVGDVDNIFSKMESSRIGRKHQFGSSNSDAEIEYRRGRSLREGRLRRES